MEFQKTQIHELWQWFKIIIIKKSQDLKLRLMRRPHQQQLGSSSAGDDQPQVLKRRLQRRVPPAWLLLGSVLSVGSGSRVVAHFISVASKKTTSLGVLLFVLRLFSPASSFYQDLLWGKGKWSQQQFCNSKVCVSLSCRTYVEQNKSDPGPFPKSPWRWLRILSKSPPGCLIANLALILWMGQKCQVNGSLYIRRICVSAESQDTPARHSSVTIHHPEGCYV